MLGDHVFINAHMHPSNIKGKNTKELKMAARCPRTVYCTKCRNNQCNYGTSLKFFFPPILETNSGLPNSEGSWDEEISFGSLLFAEEGERKLWRTHSVQPAPFSVLPSLNLANIVFKKNQEITPLLRVLGKTASKESHF